MSPSVQDQRWHLRRSAGVPELLRLRPVGMTSKTNCPVLDRASAGVKHLRDGAPVRHAVPCTGPAPVAADGGQATRRRRLGQRRDPAAAAGGTGRSLVPGGAGRLWPRLHRPPQRPGQLWGMRRLGRAGRLLQERYSGASEHEFASPAAATGVRPTHGRCADRWGAGHRSAHGERLRGRRSELLVSE
jgi:hypothetical protein